MTVQRDTIIIDILKNDPAQGCVPIFQIAGMHCLGCMAAHGETVEQAGQVPGLAPPALIPLLKDYFANQ